MTLVKEAKHTWKRTCEKGLCHCTTKYVENFFINSPETVKTPDYTVCARERPDGSWTGAFYPNLRPLTPVLRDIELKTYLFHPDVSMEVPNSLKTCSVTLISRFAVSEDVFKFTYHAESR